MNSTADAVCVNGLTQIYRHSYWRKSEVRALNGIDLCVRQGDMFGLVGPNGAGKTTLLKILTGAVRATSGEAFVFGHPAGSRPAARLLGYLPESCAFPGHLTPVHF